MLNNFLLFVLVLQSTSSFSQYALQGVVSDYASSKKIKHANIIVDTTYFENIENKKYITGGDSNENGEFEFDNIAVDNVNLLLKYIGYLTLIIENIELQKNEVTDIGNIEMISQLFWGEFFHKKGRIKKRNRKSSRNIKLIYPKNGKKIKVKKAPLRINYEDLK